MPKEETGGDKQRHRNRKRKHPEAEVPSADVAHEKRSSSCKKSKANSEDGVVAVAASLLTTSGTSRDSEHLAKKRVHFDSKRPQVEDSPSNGLTQSAGEIQPEGAPEGKRSTKERKGKRKKNAKRSGEAGSTKDGGRAALQYIRQWDADRGSWAFRKKLQYWLLRNLYDKAQVPKPEFKIMLRYLGGLHGNQRRATMEQAQRLRDQYEESAQDHDSGIAASPKGSINVPYLFSVFCES